MTIELSEDERSPLALERRMRIIEALNTRGTIGVAELTALLNASQATVRRDLAQLDEQGLLTRTRGGAVAAGRAQSLLRHFDSSYDQRQREHVEEKRAIGRAAAELVQDGETIILDAGTSTLAVVPFLTTKRDLVVITSSLAAINALVPLTHANPSITIVVAGGTLRTRGLGCVGMFTEQTLGQVFADRLFLGTRGITAAHGLTDAVPEEIAIKRAMIKAARSVIVLADHSKFHLTYTYQTAPVSAAHVVITDAGLPTELADQIAACGPHVQRAT